MFASSIFSRNKFLFVACLVLITAFVGCTTMAPDDPPFPPKATIQPPGSQIPKAVADISGIWSGQVTAQSGRFVGWFALVVNEISPVNSAGLYPARVTLVWWHSVGGNSANSSWMRSAEIQSDGSIFIPDLTKGSVRYFPARAMNGELFIRARWTWSADAYGSANLTRN